MRDLFIKQAMGIFTTITEDVNDLTCFGPMPYERALASMTMGLPVLGKAVMQHGVFSVEATAALLNYGGLALASQLHHVPLERRLDASRQLTGDLLATHPSVPYIAQTEWLQVDAKAGPFHQLTGQVLEARAMLAKIDPAERGASNMAMDAQMTAILQTVVAWCWHIAVARGDEESEGAEVVAAEA